MSKPHDGDPIEDVVSLTSIRSGAAIELFDYELNRVLENIADESTDPEEVREITLKISFKPDAERRAVAYGIRAKATKLSGPRPQVGTVFVGRKFGAVIAVEYDPTQRDMFDPERGADIVPIDQEKKVNGS